MGDDDLEASSDEADDSEESSSNESEMNSLSESVGKMKKKTISSMKKWNDEKFLFALDRQLHVLNDMLFHGDYLQMASVQEELRQDDDVFSSSFHAPNL